MLLTNFLPLVFAAILDGQGEGHGDPDDARRTLRTLSLRSFALGTLLVR